MIKISPTSKGVKLPEAFVNLMVFAEPVVIENTTHLESLPAATPNISAFIPTVIVTISEFPTIVLFP